MPILQGHRPSVVTLASPNTLPRCLFLVHAPYIIPWVQDNSPLDNYPGQFPRTIPPTVLGRTFPPGQFSPIYYAYIHIHVCIHTHTYRIHTYIQAYIYTLTYTHICIHTYSCIHIHAYINIHIQAYMHICMHVYVCMYMYVCICMCVCMCVYVYVCMYVYVCVCIIYWGNCPGGNVLPKTGG